MPAYIYKSRVAMHDTDAAGIVYFGSFFHYAEEAETHALASLGTIVTRDGYLYPRVHVEADYHQPLHFFDAVSIKASLTRIGSTSLRWQFDISGPQGLAATVRAVSSRRFPDNSPAPYSEEEKSVLNRLTDSPS